MFVNFSEEVRHIIKQAEYEKEILNHPYVGSEHLLLALMHSDVLSSIFNNYNLTYDRFRKRLIDFVGVGSKKTNFVLYTPLLKRILENAVIIARERKARMVDSKIVLISLLDEEDGVANSIMKSLKININGIYNDVKKITNKGGKKKKTLLDEVGVDLTNLAKEKKLDPVIGREKEIRQAVEILVRRKKNNPILIGPAGCGKTAIVEEIANLMNTKKCPNYLKGKRLISINIFALVSGTKYRGEFEEKMKTLIKELEDNQDVILFIDEVHTVVGAGGAEGAIDASNIFKPALARGSIKIIGATTIEEYKKYIEPDQALARRFQIVNIKEPDKSTMKKILLGIKPLYEKYHNVKVNNSLIEKILDLSDKYLVNRYEPDRSIDILDESCAKTSVLINKTDKLKQKYDEKLTSCRKLKNKVLKKRDFSSAVKLAEEEKIYMEKISKIKKIKKTVLYDTVLDVVKEKANVKKDNCNLNYFKNLKSDLKKDIVGRDNIIDDLVRILYKKEMSVSKRLFCVNISGKSGIGKSFFVKTFLKKVCNDFITIDLSFYKEPSSISKLIGTTAGYVGYDNKNNIFEKIRNNPSIGIIIYNYNKGCEEVKNIFNEIIKNNRVEDATGKMIDFSNTYIVFVDELESGACVGFNSKENNKNMNESQLMDNIYINKLDKENILFIIKNTLEKVKKDYRSDIQINHAIISKIYEKYKDEKLSMLLKKAEYELEDKIINMVRLSKV